VYPGGVQGTIGLRVQNRFNIGKYRCTRTRNEEEFGARRCRLAEEYRDGALRPFFL
jgi:hypothetical protein